MTLKSKAISYLILLVIILAVIGAGYLLITSNSALKDETEAARTIIDDHERLTDMIANEKMMCEELITAGTSTFGDFAYCEKFLEFESSTR